ncbi:MAG TPA: hypothetical protein VHA52_09905 [Candidatus Babeliaceae bacterium]|nr:hypothetical protein [Candidatus Babeliaceae bacterium]
MPLTLRTGRQPSNSASNSVDISEYNRVLPAGIRGEATALARLRDWVSAGLLSAAQLNQVNPVLSRRPPAPTPKAVARAPSVPSSPSVAPSSPAVVPPSIIPIPNVGPGVEPPFLNIPAQEGPRTRLAERNEARARHQRANTSARINAYRELHQPGTPNPYEIGGGGFYINRWHPSSIPERNYGRISTPEAQLYLDDQQALFQQLNPGHSLLERHERVGPPRAELVEQGWFPRPAQHLTAEGQAAARGDFRASQIERNNELGRTLNNVVVGDLIEDILKTYKGPVAGYDRNIDYRESARQFLKNPFLNPAQVSSAQGVINSRFSPIPYPHQRQETFPISSGEKAPFRGFSGLRGNNMPIPERPMEMDEFSALPGASYPDWGPLPFENYKTHLSQNSKVNRIFDARNRNKWHL